MISLYIDTSSSYLYTGIVKDEALLVETKQELGQQLSIEALPQIINNFEKVALNPRDIDTIIVVTGPGSFTGIRIGVTIAKVMAWSLNKKIIPISALQAMALSADNATYYIPMIDARRGYVFGGIYDSMGKNVVEDSYLLLTELETKAKEFSNSKVITNSDIKTSLMKEKYQPDIKKIVNYFKEKDGCYAHLINPNYLKQTEAEEKAGL